MDNYCHHIEKDIIKKETNIQLSNRKGRVRNGSVFLVCDTVCYGHWQPLMNQKLIVENLCFLKELTKQGLRGE